MCVRLLVETEHHSVISLCVSLTKYILHPKPKYVPTCIINNTDRPPLSSCSALFFQSAIHNLQRQNVDIHRSDILIDA